MSGDYGQAARLLVRETGSEPLRRGNRQSAVGACGRGGA